MGIFDFLKTKTASDYYGKLITFNVDSINNKVLLNCKIGDYVNLWTKYDMKRIMIYAPNSSGSDSLGMIPSKYSKAIQDHILEQVDYGFSGPSTNNYDATIIDINGSRCVIEMKLLSPAEHKIAINNMVEKAKSTMKKDLERKYKMKKPVEVTFSIKSANKTNLENLRLNVLEKEFYIENPYEYKLQLIDINNNVVAETFSQKDKIFRVIKGFYNDQKLSIVEIEKKDDYLKTIIGEEETS